MLAVSKPPLITSHRGIRCQVENIFFSFRNKRWSTGFCFHVNGFHSPIRADVKNALNYPELSKVAGRLSDIGEIYWPITMIQIGGNIQISARLSL
jgi:hypothetical protein